MLTKNDCIKVLENFLHTTEIKFKSFELKPISEESEGFMGEHHKLLIKHELNGKEQTEHFFIKTKPTKNRAQLEMVQELGLYKREIFVYDFLLKEFQKYKLDTSFAANSYYCIPDTALIMDDLTLQDFSITERHQLLSLEQVKCCLNALAKYHAAGFAYEKIRSKELGRKFCLGEEYYENIKEPFYVQHIDPTAYSMQWWRGSEKTISTLISLLPYDEHYRQSFEELVKNFENGKIFVENTNISKTCGHGDLWSNNFMFKYEGTKAKDCRLVDFQVLRYFYPSFDVVLMIFCNTSAEFRKIHLEDLYKYYHITLKDILCKYGYEVENIHPWKDFRKSINIVKPDALSQVLLAKCIVCLPKEKLSDIVKEDGNEFAELIFDNDKIVAAGFKNDEDYRQIILHSMMDYYEALVNKT